MIMGMAPRCAYAAPVARLSAPGPRVEMQTPGFPVSRPCVAAMKAAACSCRVRTSSIFELRSDSTTSRFSSPGTPKIRSTPSFSNAATNRSEPFTMFSLPAFCAQSRREAVDDRAREIRGRDLATEIGGPQIVDLQGLLDRPAQPLGEIFPVDVL